MRVLTAGTDRGLFPLASELAWQREAACRGLGVEESRAIFFPAPGKCIDEARAICGACPVREQCLDFALTNGCIGVWGGTTERERSRLRQRNRTSARQLIGSS
jgi:WhiB family transcriptional regulator, redox-sensing transcriptional regulator